MVACPDPSAHQPIDCRANCQEEKKAGRRDLLVVLAQSQKRSVQNEDRQGHPIDETHASPNGAAPGCECRGHILTGELPLRMSRILRQKMRWEITRKLFGGHLWHR